MVCMRSASATAIKGYRLGLPRVRKRPSRTSEITWTLPPKRPTRFQALNNMGYIPVCDCDLCDCDHDRSEHAGAGCRECANTWSPDGACRAGGFANSETRLTILKERWNLYPFAASDCIIGVAGNGDAESYARTMPVETVMELAIESYEETDQEPALSFASHHN